MLPDALSGVTVVEWAAGVAGPYAARLLLELGADVVKVEGPDGDWTRHAPPVGAGGSALFFHYNVGKKGVTVDVTTAGGRDRLLALLEGADVLVEDQPPGRLDSFGFGPERLRERNPGLVHLSLTPFGAEGPRRHWRTYPLIDLHAGGEGWELVQTPWGEVPDPDAVPSRAPVMTGGDATEGFCGLMAAIGVLAALRRRRETGRGNFIDLSKQEASLWPGRVELSGFPNAGVRGRRRIRERIPGGVFPAADGWVEIMPFEDRMWEGLIDAMGHPGWAADPRYADRPTRLASASEINPHIAEWTRSQRARDVHERLQTLGCPACEVMTSETLAASAHYAARGFFAPVGGIGGAPVRIPSTPFGGPKPRYRPAPGLGEHDGELFVERPRPEPGVPTAGGEHAVDEPAVDRSLLSGVRVLDLTFNRAGPSCTAMLAALGAEVIRAESHTRIDPNRLKQASKPPGGQSDQVVYGAATTAGVEDRWGFGSVNMGKLGILLNLHADEAPDLVRRLVGVCDVVVESFAPGALERFGLGYETLRTWRSDVVLVSVNGFGRGGPDERYRAYADIFGAAGGLQHVTGYPDDPPMFFVGRLDSVVGCFAALGTLAALADRDSHGVGQHVDVSAAESVSCLLGAPLLDYLFNGRVASRSGNHVAGFGPHGCYPCAGPDDWVAIAVRTDAEWEALCSVIGDPSLADPRFVSSAGRQASAEELDASIEAWTRGHDSESAADRLQEAGVAASPSMRADQLFSDAHLRARGAWVRYEHPVQGERYDIRLPWIFAEGGTVYGPAPLMGQHDDYVYGGLLGLSEERIADLRRREVIF